MIKATQEDKSEVTWHHKDLLVTVKLNLVKKVKVMFYLSKPCSIASPCPEGPVASVTRSSWFIYIP